MTARDAVLSAVRGLSPADPVTLPAGWLQSLLAAPDPTVTVDLTAARVAELLGCDPCTVTRWIRAGLLPGAYKRQGKSYRIPPSALELFQRQQAGEHA